MFLGILSAFDVYGLPKKEQKCLRNVSKQINPLQVDNLITDKSGNL
jgi:hypothetical protein